MKSPRMLRWDSVRERFLDDGEANALLCRPQRIPCSMDVVDGLEGF